MRSVTMILGVVAVLCMPLPATAQQETPELQALDDALPGTLINDPSRLDWKIYGAGQKYKNIKGAEIPGGGAAVQIISPSAGRPAYEITAEVPMTSGITAGKQITIAFYARTVKAETPSGDGVVGVRFQQNMPPYPGFGDTRLTIGKEWKLYEVTAMSNVTIAKGQSIAAFQMSGAKQTIEIGQAIIVSGAGSIAKKSEVAQYATTALLPQLVGKGELISDPDDKSWSVYGKGETHKTVPSPNIPGTGGTALQLSVTAPPANIYDIGVAIPIKATIKTGDMILVAILARTAPGGTADGTSKIGVRINQNAPPFPGFGENVFTAGSGWKLLQLKSQATTDIAGGKGVLVLHLGTPAQSVEIGQVYVINTSSIAPLTTNP